ncbi:hypothetical protein UFOVP27_14 [uncultured Caudovirales phage]|uniref:Uncharacterized protein n=1 Tax=uncultured Caudovirales phage TaxID=2100421 RepID=A0A6J5KL26_9CAUD|nr:hypothetical protein UFOVP27_14 [uncultured Caudovirales phage]
MRKLLVKRKKLINKINQLMLEEHQDNQFEDSQTMRSYSAGIIDGLGMVLGLLSNNPAQEAHAFPISLSFYEENNPTRDVEAMRERLFDMQRASKLSLFYEEVD